MNSEATPILVGRVSQTGRRVSEALGCDVLRASVAGTAHARAMGSGTVSEQRVER